MIETESSGEVIVYSHAVAVIVPLLSGGVSGVFAFANLDSRSSLSVTFQCWWYLLIKLSLRETALILLSRSVVVAKSLSEVECR